MLKVLRAREAMMGLPMTTHLENEYTALDTPQGCIQVVFMKENLC